MAGRDDFGSNMNSPGGWGGSGGGGMGGGMGGGKSSTNYNYSSGAGQRGPAIGNWNTGGPVVARGNQFGTRGVGFPGGFAGAVSGGLLGNVVRPPMPTIPRPRPNAYPPVTQEEIPGAPPPAWQPQRYVNPGYGMDPNGIGRTVTPRTAPQGYFGPSQPTYSRDGQGHVSNAGPAGGATYARMGSDFRSIDSW